MLQHEKHELVSTEEEIRTNLATIEARIQAACARAGRARETVRLLPVSKTRPPEVLQAAYNVGVRVFGENKVQEARMKADALQHLADVRWSVIGHLQTNKIKHMARFAHEFQALDSLRVAETLNQRLRLEERHMDVLIQVNTSEEASKFGFEPDAVADFLPQLTSLERLRVRGLMTLAVFSDDVARVRQCFITLRQLRDRLRDDLPEGMSMDELSMGMSGDFEVAIEEGATCIRVGQAIFGSRSTPDSHYWPNSS